MFISLIDIFFLDTLYTLMVIFMLTPLPPLIFHGANETTRPLLHIVEYYVDMDKYYFPILIHGYLTVIICVTSIVATDAIFVIFVQHVCGLFIVTGWVALSFLRRDLAKELSPRLMLLFLYMYSSRLERALQEKHVTDTNLPITEDKAYRNMIQCVQDHRGAIRFVSFAQVPSFIWSSGYLILKQRTLEQFWPIAKILLYMSQNKIL